MNETKFTGMHAASLSAISSLYDMYATGTPEEKAIMARIDRLLEHPTVKQFSELADLDERCTEGCNQVLDWIEESLK